MKHAFSISFAATLTAILLAMTPAVANAQCYADYKAKQDNPLKLHYGVAQIAGDCSASAAAAELAPRVEADGWVLLNVLSVFGEEGLQERKESAGRYFLRY